MLERPPGGTTIRRPAGLMGMSSGVMGGPGTRAEERKIEAGHLEKGEELARQSEERTRVEKKAD